METIQEHRRLAIRLAILAFALSTVVPVKAETPTIEQWQNAKSAADNGKGCESIPYSEYQANCTNLRSEVESKCKQDAWSCERLKTKSLLQRIDNLSRAIETWKAQLDTLSRLPDGNDEDKRGIDEEKKDYENDIGKGLTRLADLKKSLQQDLWAIDINLGNGAACLDARTAVQKVFASATNDAQRVGDSDAEIKKIADFLINYWAEGDKKHQEEFGVVSAGIEKCKQCRSGSL